MGKKKYKPLTKKEKAFNKQIKAEMIAKGILPPPKPRLNRRKFAEDVKEEFNEMSSYDDYYYVFQAISLMTPTRNHKISSEELGVLKMMKLAIGIKKFLEQKTEAGEDSYNSMELFKEVVYPIMKL